MSYALENALFQWEEGERRLNEADARERPQLERVTRLVLDELRRRLGGEFAVAELADLYGAGTDWAGDIAKWAGAANGGAYNYGRFSWNLCGYGATRPSGSPGASGSPGVPSPTPPGPPGPQPTPRPTAPPTSPPSTKKP